MNTYNTKVEGVMRNQKIHLWLPVVFLLLTAVGGSAVVAAETPSLAILNFSNQNLDEPEWQWLSKGLADMLVTDLSRTNKFQLIDRDTIQEYLDEIGLSDTGVIDERTALKVGQIAEVRKALFGNFRITNEQLEINAFIVNVADNEIERVESVRGPVKNVLDLEKTLALKIVENLQVPLTQTEIASIRFKPTDSLDATTRFYQGLDGYDQGQYFDALRQFRLAARTDPSYDKPLLFQGHVLENLGEYEHAILAFKKLASDIPESEFAVDALFTAAKLLADEFGKIDEALLITDQIIDSYADGKVRDGTVVAEKYGPAPAIVVRGNYHYSLPAIMHLYKANLHVRTEDYSGAMHEIEAALDGIPEAYRNGNTYNLRQLVKYAYGRTGEVLIPSAAPKVIELNPHDPVYEENYSSGKRLEDAFELQSSDSEWGNEILKPYGYDAENQQHYISNKYSGKQKQWMTTGDTYLFAVPEDYVVESVDVWLEGYQTQPWTLDALVVAVGDYNSKGATGGPRTGHVEDHYRAPVLAGTRLFELLIQIAGDFTKKTDQFAYINGWRIKANLKKVAKTASLNISANMNVLVFLDPVPGQVRNAESIFWRGNPSIDCPCQINNLSVGTHKLVAFAADAGRSIRNDGRRQEFVVDIRPDQVNEISISYPSLQIHNEAADVLPGWQDFHRVLGEFTKVGSGGQVHQVAGMQNQDGTYQALFTSNFDIWITTSADGVRWEKSEPLPGPVNTLSQEGPFSIIQGEDGVFYMAFLSARGEDQGLYVSSSANMKRWVKPRKVASLEQFRDRPSLLQLEDGTFRIYFAPKSHLLSYVASTDFKTWTKGTETEVKFQNFQQVVADESGRFWLLFGGYENRDHLFFIASSKDGTNWEEFSRIDISDTDHALGSFHPVLVPAARTGVALAWERAARLAFSHSRDGINWSPSSAEIESQAKLGYPDAPFAFFRNREGAYLLLYSNSHNELWSTTSTDPFQ